MRNYAFVPVILACLAVTPAFSLSDKPYVTAQDIDFADLMPAPPADGTPGDQRDLQQVLAIQKTLTPQDNARIQADLPLDVFRFSTVLGPDFTKEKFPLTAAFFAKVNKDSGVGVGPLKQKYKRKRPWQASSAVVTPANIQAIAMGPTFPSGHATFGTEVAILLSMAVPEKRTELFARGWQYGDNRVMSGVAYPTDTETSRMMAPVILAAMMQKPEFKADFEAVKAEIRKGLNLPG
jgi:acid phosphatase (class A)